MLVLLDTNILLRAAEPAHAQNALAVSAVRILRQSGNTLCLVPQVLYEFWVVATRPVDQNGLGLTPAEADAELRNLGPPLFRLLRDERAIYDAWRQLVLLHSVRGKTAHDARIVAAMQRHGLTHLVSANPGDFSRFPGITVLTPAQICSQPNP
jgi:predicted nucleic acid-binding protein